MNQRLCIYLDGTWNTENSSTNIQHAYNLTEVGVVEDRNFKKWNQLKFYDRGVGTGLLDSFSGGLLGQGMDENIREAYVWLVQNYNDGDDIFIFGFSRGAYAARALSSWITKIGIVKRGAPIPVSEMWQHYVLDSSNEEKFKVSKVQPWAWTSRTVQYLGVYDTVGALGLGTLGIPGIGVKADLKYNYYPKPSIKKCRHAISIDENRSSFDLTAMQEYVHNKNGKESTLHEQVSQRWFPGAHSNVGGGYDQNYLSLGPLIWITKGAVESGLVINREIEEIKTEYGSYLKSSEAQYFNNYKTDSYLDFAGWVWPNILREKRNYRQMLLQDDFKPMVRLKRISEDISDEALLSVKNDQNYCPPNLKSFVERATEQEKKRFPNIEKLDELMAKRDPLIDWPALTSVSSTLVLVLWSLIASLGFYTLLTVVNFANNSGLSDVQIFGGVALFAIVADFFETYFGHWKARSPQRASYDVWWYIALWHRFMFFSYFIIGVISIVYHFFTIINKLCNLPHAFIVQGYSDYWIYCIIPILTIGLLAMVDMMSHVSGTTYEEDTDTYKNTPRKDNKVRPKVSMKLKNKSRLLFLLLFALILFPVFFVLMFSIAEGLPTSCPSTTSTYSYLLTFLLLSICFYGLIWVFKWASLPMSRRGADMGSILELQACISSKMRAEVFKHFKSSVSSPLLKPEDINKSLSRVLRMSIIRDSFGLVVLSGIVIYAFVSIGYCYNIIDPSFLSFMNVQKPLFGFICLFMIMDWIENHHHLAHLELYLDIKSNKLIFIPQFMLMLLSLVKSLIFIGLLFVMVYIYLNILYRIFDTMSFQPRIATFVLIFISSILIISVRKINPFILIASMAQRLWNGLTGTGRRIIMRYIATKS